MITGLSGQYLHAFNAVYMYRRTVQQIDGHTCFASAAGHHLFRHPEPDEWHLRRERHDPAKLNCWAQTNAAGGPVPIGRRAWMAFIDGKWIVS